MNSVYRGSIPAFYFLALLTVAPAVAADDKPPAKEEIAKWVQQLGDNEYATREKASEQLWQAGRAAEQAVREATRSDDPEIARRALQLHSKFKWGIYPDTPAKIAEHIARYQTGDAPAKLVVIKELFDMGGAGCATLVKVSRAEENADLRRQLAQHVGQEAGRAIALLQAENNLISLDELFEAVIATHLELRVPGPDADLAFQNYAVYWLLRGKLDDKIAYFKNLHDTPHDKPAGAKIQDEDRVPVAHYATVLVFLYRVKGDLKNACWAAEKSGRSDLLETVRYDQSDWKALAKKADEIEDTSNIEALGFRAAYHRLAGNKDEFEKLIGELRKHVQAEQPDENRLWFVAKALFVNGQPEDGLAALTRRKNLGPALEVLCAQMKYREALELADSVREDGSRNGPYVEIVRARALYALGEKDKSLEIFAKLGEDIRDAVDWSWIESLIKTEVRLHLKELALEHVGRYLTTRSLPIRQARCFELLFAGQSETAAVWWQFLRQKYPDDKPAEVLKKVGIVVRGQHVASHPGAPANGAANDSLEQLIEEAGGMALKLGTDERDKWLIALGEAALAAGKSDLALALWEKHAPSSTGSALLLRLGHFRADKKQWQEAGERYRQAWEKDRKEPLPLYLQGRALSQSGKAEAGRKLMETAHWLPLGNEAGRHQFAGALAARGQTEAAQRERELLLRLSKPTSYYGGDALRQTAVDALSRKDYLEAAAANERAMLRILNPNIYFVESGAYVIVPYQIHRNRALGLLAAGRIEEMRKELQICQTFLPANVDLAMYLVPELDRNGHKKDADELFAKAWIFHDKWCTGSPNSALAHNDIAWLAARSQRELDKGEKHARKAVELAPDFAGYRDTLAEVCFQRGEKDKAVELMKKCVEMEPTNLYYQKQLKRIEAGDPKAALPEVGG